MWYTTTTTKTGKKKKKEKKQFASQTQTRGLGEGVVNVEGIAWAKTWHHGDSPALKSHTQRF